MTTRTTLALLLWLAAAATSPATELATPATVAEQSALSAYTTPLETMFGIVEQINTQLASAQDEESAEAAGEAIQELLQVRQCKEDSPFLRAVFSPVRHRQ